jgi:hypothetical protein
MKKLLTGISLLAAGLISLPASATPIPSILTQVQHTFSGNDCSGYFGTGFGSCQIFFGEDDDRVEISPVIAKYDIEDEGTAEDETAFNTTLFPSFSGTEISYNLDDQDWTYTPGEDDPGIRYLAAKGGNYFNLLWYVDTNTVGSACDVVFSLACLNLAQAVEQGSWTTPMNDNSGNPYGLSHLTFYDSVPPRLVSEPGTIGLLALSMLGLGLARRRTARQS